jgi:adenylate kinase family enzyme
MLIPKELLNLTPEERDVVLLRCLWRFFCIRQDFSIELLSQKTTHSEEFIKNTLLKVRKQTRLKFEIYDLEAQLKNILEQLFYERGKRQPNKNS